jgi:hypothetical protein
MVYSLVAVFMAQVAEPTDWVTNMVLSPFARKSIHRVSASSLAQIRFWFN